MTQRPSRVSIQYRDKLNALLKQVEKHNINEQIGSSPIINLHMVPPIQIHLLI